MKLKKYLFLCIEVTLILVSCNHKTTKESSSVEYQCPMKCEGVDKTYDKPGSCPVCKMELKEVEQ